MSTNRVEDWSRFVRGCRVARNLSRDAVASACDVSTSYVRHMECGKVIPSPRVVRRVAAALGVTTAEALATAGYMPDGLSWSDLKTAVRNGGPLIPEAGVTNTIDTQYHL